MTLPNISPELYDKFVNCSATSRSVEQSFSMLRKLLPKIAISHQKTFENIWHDMQINPLRRSLSFKMLVFKCNFFLQPLSKIKANISRFHCNKNFPNYCIQCSIPHRRKWEKGCNFSQMFDNHIHLRRHSFCSGFCDSFASASIVFLFQNKFGGHY